VSLKATAFVQYFVDPPFSLVTTSEYAGIRKIPQGNCNTYWEHEEQNGDAFNFILFLNWPCDGTEDKENKHVIHDTKGCDPTRVSKKSGWDPDSLPQGHHYDAKRSKT